MNISEALCAAADHIERHPESYQFMEGSIPCDGAQGCMLGFFGRYAGLPVGLDVGYVAWAVLGQDPSEFYNEVHSASGAGHPRNLGDSVVYDKKLVAPAMRTVAKKYEGVPQEVREIFESKAPSVPYPIGTRDFYRQIAVDAAMRYRELQARKFMEAHA
jgi:hypothetical protein